MRPVVIPNIEALGQRYVEGATLKQLAEESGVCQSAFKRALGLAGFTLRDPSTVSKNRWKSFTAEQRVSILKAGHDSVRGSVQTPEAKAKRALARFKNVSCQFPYEDRVDAILTATGYETVLQQAVGPYNIDVAIPDIKTAVEICRIGPAKFVSSRGPERVRYLIASGWRVILILFNQTALNETHVAIELLGTLHGETPLRVIWGTGHPGKIERYGLAENNTGF